MVETCQRDKLLPVFKLLSQNGGRRVAGEVQRSKELFHSKAPNTPRDPLVSPYCGPRDQRLQIKIGQWQASAMTHTVFRRSYCRSLEGNHPGGEWSGTQGSRQNSGVEYGGDVSWDKGREVRKGGELA